MLTDPTLPPASSRHRFSDEAHKMAAIHEVQHNTRTHTDTQTQKFKDTQTHANTHTHTLLKADF